MRKNKNDLIYYYGVPGFTEGTGTAVTLENDTLLLTNHNGSKATLALSQIQSIGIMLENEYMLKYHNEKTKNDYQRWFYVIHYISSSGDNKHMVFWSATSGRGYKFFREMQNTLAPTITQL